MATAAPSYAVGIVVLTDLAERLAAGTETDEDRAKLREQAIFYLAQARREQLWRSCGFKPVSGFGVSAFQMPVDLYFILAMIQLVRTRTLPVVFETVFSTSGSFITANIL